MDVKFHFEFVGENRFGQVYRPIAKVSFESPLSKKWISTWMIVDTGADHSILPKHLSEKLRISLERDCVKDVTVGIGGEKSIYFMKEKIKVKLGDNERRIPIAFIDSDETPPLLGRLGFLETFNTEFLKSHTVVFKN